MSLTTPLVIQKSKSDKKDELTNGISLKNLEHDTVYEDFHTIDWIRDRTRDRMRHRKMKERRQLLGWRAWFDQKWGALSGWLVVFLIGVCSGVLAGAVDIGAVWMSDLKEGICVDWLYYDQESCCWLSNQTSFDVDHCDSWKTWDEQAGVEEIQHSHYTFSWFGYFIYTIFAVFFGGLAGFFVVTVAPYAAGSGIPEVSGS